MRISDWSSDVCSSDLSEGSEAKPAAPGNGIRFCQAFRFFDEKAMLLLSLPSTIGMLMTPPTSIRLKRPPEKIGRATSELQSLMRISYAVFCLKKKNRFTQPKQVATTQ